MLSAIRSAQYAMPTLGDSYMLILDAGQVLHTTCRHGRRRHDAADSFCCTHTPFIFSRLLYFRHRYFALRRQALSFVAAPRLALVTRSLAVRPRPPPTVTSDHHVITSHYVFMPPPRHYYVRYIFRRWRFCRFFAMAAEGLSPRLFFFTMLITLASATLNSRTRFSTGCFLRRPCRHAAFVSFQSPARLSWSFEVISLLISAAPYCQAERRGRFFMWGRLLSACLHHVFLRS